MENANRSISCFDRNSTGKRYSLSRGKPFTLFLDCSRRVSYRGDGEVKAKCRSMGRDICR